IKFTIVFCKLNIFIFAFSYNSRDIITVDYLCACFLRIVRFYSRGRSDGSITQLQINENAIQYNKIKVMYSL
ncbi:MAG TPA: hypothetical protein PK426_03470, partial [Spirochaetota bacterium]|nr:hypothetical protein [Spirochaetota bacterium]